MRSSTEISLAAVGDISFKGRHENKPSAHIFSQVRPLFKDVDLVIGNLESPLVSEKAVPIPGKCTLRGEVGWAAVLQASGIHLVSLANNHIMDFGEERLFSTIEALEKAKILHVGAGKNINEACSPVFVRIRDTRIAFLARSSVDVSSPSYAGINQAGIAFLEEQELLSTIQECRKDADLVVAMLHWGIEHYQYPSPQQRILAKKIISAGAQLILGHHPHVLQGEEKIEDGLVSYSSGNFLFDEFLWSIELDDGQRRSFFSSLTDENRKGMIVQVSQLSGKYLTISRTFTKINDNAIIMLDIKPEREKMFLKLCARLNLPFYSFLWKLYSVKCEWDLRIKRQVSLKRLIKKIHKIRKKHFKELIRSIRRSARVSSGKSTNPYE